MDTPAVRRGPRDLIGATVRGRVECGEDGIAVECALRICCRGVGLAVIALAGIPAGVAFLYILLEYFHPR